MEISRSTRLQSVNSRMDGHPACAHRTSPVIRDLPDACRDPRFALDVPALFRFHPVGCGDSGKSSPSGILALKHVSAVLPTAVFGRFALPRADVSRRRNSAVDLLLPLGLGAAQLPLSGRTSRSARSVTDSTLACRHSASSVPGPLP